MNSQRLIAAVVLLVLTSTCVAQTQDTQQKRQPTPEESQKTMESFFSTLAPAQAKAAEASLDLATNYAARPEVAERIAAFKKNLFDSLKRRGFTDEQALQITLATPLPSLR